MEIKASNGTNFIMWVFLAVGLVLMCVGICVAIYLGVDSQNYVKVSATITDITTSRDSDGDVNYVVSVDFEFSGEHYTDIPTGFWVQGMYEGEQITIYCHKDNPTNIRSGSIMIILPCVLFGMGALNTLIIAFPIHRMLKQHAMARQIRKTGEMVRCKITAVIPDTSYRVNGRIVNNFIECQPIDENITATYKSQSFNQKYPVTVDDVVNVYVDAIDSSKYYVDLNSIEQADILAEYYAQDFENSLDDNQDKNKENSV